MMMTLCALFIYKAIITLVSIFPYFIKDLYVSIRTYYVCTEYTQQKMIYSSIYRYQFGIRKSPLNGYESSSKMEMLRSQRWCCVGMRPSVQTTLRQVKTLNLQIPTYLPPHLPYTNVAFEVYDIMDLNSK